MLMSGEEELSWFKWAEEATHPGQAAKKPEALDDLLVLDVSHAHIGGLVCSSMLAEMGARVIRIEPPSGDLARQFTPFGIRHQDTGLGYLAEGRNKHHITLNLQDPQGQDIFKSFARHADVVIETFKPGTMDAWGIGYRQLQPLNPRIIYAALASYGQFGPKAGTGRPGSEITNQAYSGLVQINGEPESDGPAEHAVPTKVGSWYGWYAEGLFGAYGILLALNFRAGYRQGPDGRCLGRGMHHEVYRLQSQLVPHGRKDQGAAGKLRPGRVSLHVHPLQGRLHLSWQPTTMRRSTP